MRGQDAHLGAAHEAACGVSGPGANETSNWPPGSTALTPSSLQTTTGEGQAPFSIFGDSLKKAVAALRFAGGLASSRLEGGLADDLVAQYGDHSAALVICASGAGTLAVLNADLGRSNLPASPLFVPLVDELVDRLLGDRKRGSPIFSGEPVAVYLPAEVHTAAGLRIDAGTAAGAPALGELIDEAQGVVWRMQSAVPPGIYRVERGAETVFALASELVPEESDLRHSAPRC